MRPPNKNAFTVDLHHEYKRYRTIEKLLIAISLAAFSWIGLGTPFIWLINSNTQNEALYQNLQIGTYAALILIFGFLLVLKIKSYANELIKFWPLICFISYLLISLTWSPLNLFEKINILMSVALCVAVAVTTLLILGAQKLFCIIMISIGAYVLATWLSNKQDIYQPMGKLLFFYGFIIFLSFFSILRVITFKIEKHQTIFILFVSIIGCFYLLIPQNFYVSNNTPYLVTNGWVVFRGDHGLFMNLNLHNRVLQIAFIVSLLVILLVRNGQQGASEMSLYVVFSLGLVIAVLLNEHRASTGRFVMFGSLGYFLLLLVWCQLKTLNCNRPKLIGLVSVTVVVVTTLVFTIAFWTKFDSVESGVLVKLYERNDFFSRLEIWTNSLNLLNSTQLIFGVGLDGFWVGEQKFSHMDPALKTQAHAHNGFVDMVLQSGIISVVLLMVAWLQTARKLHLSSYMADDVRLTLLSVFYLGSLGLILMNIFESVILPTTSATLLPFTLLVILLLLPMEPKFNTPQKMKNFDSK